MRVRRPDFDFSSSSAHWAKNPEFAQFWNSTSTAFPGLERFLNKCMARAASKLDGDNAEDAALRSDIRTFIRQESNHYTLHERFNDMIRRNGYDIAPLEAMIESEYERLWETKSFAFCLAYCEGFEAMGPPFAHVMLDQFDEPFDGADPEVVSLWKWHLMEEFEHRNVCYDVFHRFHGGYFLRLYGFFYQLWHLGGMIKKVRKFLLEQDRETMSPDELRESDRRLKEVSKLMGKGFARRLLRALSPRYSPHCYEEPRNFRRTMEALEPRVS